METVILIGPQASQPNIRKALQLSGVEGRVCAVTAGWQERAGELAALREHLDREVVNLELYYRAEEVFEQDPEFFSAHRQRQNLLRELQTIYRTRLYYHQEAVLRLLEMQGTDSLLTREREAAIESVRQLDRQHVERTREIRHEFEEEWKSHERPSIARQISKVRRIVASCSAILVAGGHVAVLLNRLRLFNLTPLLWEKPVIAWSAGAMALSERVILFHDSPPQGPGAAEVLEAGLGRIRNIVPLPHAEKRLRLQVPHRVAFFASRFRPAQCLAMDGGALLCGDGESWLSSENLVRLTESGNLRTELQP